MYFMDFDDIDGSSVIQRRRQDEGFQRVASLRVCVFQTFEHSGDCLMMGETMQVRTKACETQRVCYGLETMEITTMFFCVHGFRVVGGKASGGSCCF